VAVWASLALPSLAVLGIGATELVELNRERARLQDVVDTAALNGAHELGSGASEGLGERVKAAVIEAAGPLAPGRSLTPAAEVDGDLLHVSAESRRPSFFGSMLPPGGFRTAVATSAQAVRVVPTCVTALKADGEVIKLEERAKLEAPRCGVAGNDNIEVQRDARLTGASVHATGIRKGTGPILPEVLTGAPVTADPFRTKTLDFGGCLTTPKQDIKVEHDQTRTLAPGVHRGKLEITNTASVTLAAGVHVFCDGDLLVKDEARLSGAGVALLFRKDAKLKFENDAQVDLTGARTGAWAGFLIAAARDNTGDFEIKSVGVRRLEGVIYLPAAKLKVDTTQFGAPPVEGDVSEAAKWTVAVVSELNVKGAPHLYVNDDYAGSPVPLPQALRPSGAKLVR
jgi:hypothetical protein